MSMNEERSIHSYTFRGLGTLKSCMGYEITSYSTYPSVLGGRSKPPQSILRYPYSVTCVRGSQVSGSCQLPN